MKPGDKIHFCKDDDSRDDESFHSNTMVDMAHLVPEEPDISIVQSQHIHTMGQSEAIIEFVDWMHFMT